MRVEEALEQIVKVTHTIFSVDGAGLMLADADHHLRNVAASDDRMGHLEELQISYQEGPCIRGQSPQMSRATSTMRRSLASCSSRVSALPSTVEENPHWPDRPS
jgi:hypothetical protein